MRFLTVTDVTIMQADFKSGEKRDVNEGLLRLR